MRNRLYVGISWSAVGAAFYAGCQWAMVVVLAKLGSVEAVGELALALAIAGPVFLLFGLNLRVAQATDSARHFGLSEYLLVRVLTTLLALISVVMLAFLWPPARDSWVILVLVAVVKSSDAITEVVIGRFQQIERFDLIGKIQIIRGVAGLFAFVAAFTMFRDLKIAVGAWALSWIVLGLLAVRGVGQLHWSPAGWYTVMMGLTKSKQLLLSSVPLGLAAVMDSLVLNVPKYFLQSLLGLEAVGVFSAIAYLMTVGGIVIGAIGFAVTPRFARFGVGQRAEFRALMRKSLLVASLVGLSGIVIAGLWGDRLLSLLYSEEYSRYQTAFLFMMVAATLWYLAGLVGCGLNGLRQFKRHALVQGLALLSTIAACFVLIPKLGVDGAAAAAIVGMAIRLAGASLALAAAFRGPHVHR